MTGIFTQRLHGIDKNPALLQALSSLQRGIEKESLRVDGAGQLALTPHPKTLGSALTHAKITTDYSEALLEFITPVCTSISEISQCLQDIHQFTYHRLAEQNELLWTDSMPCALPANEQIPVAQYGQSNVGKMKTVYRIGLGHRYGRDMQTISGIHYNFSLIDRFWEKYRQQQSSALPLSAFKTEQYFALMRNFKRFVPLIIYLFGASPAVNQSFMQGKKHSLEAFNDSFIGEYATSLRMGDFGYQSHAQDALFVCYNSLERYIHSLRDGITISHQPYQAIGVKDKNGQYLQLNSALLQIENEFYNNIRPKRVAASGEAPVNALARGGVEYIEVRCMDLDPFSPVGIDNSTMRFLDMFLLYCLFEHSPLLPQAACNEANQNLQRVVNEGRKPNLLLHVEGQPIELVLWAEQIFAHLKPIAELLDSLNAKGCYQQSLNEQYQKIHQVQLTPSARVLEAMRQNQLSFAEFALKQSQHWQAHFLNRPLSEQTQSYFSELAADSIAQQQAIEKADRLSFDDYLAHYYQQYQG